MKNTKHTQGEWKYYDTINPMVESHPLDKGIITPKTTLVASIYPVCLNKDSSIDEGKQRESIANAKLIAAAPDMIEALSEWINLNVKYINEVPIIDSRNKKEREIVVKMIAAYKKATA